MAFEELVGITILSIIIWSVIVYYVVKTAIISAFAASVNKQDRVNEIMLRIMVKQLEKEGMSKKEIVDIYNKTNDEFWSSIKE